MAKRLAENPYALYSFLIFWWFLLIDVLGIGVAVFDPQHPSRLTVDGQISGSMHGFVKVVFNSVSNIGNSL